MNKTPVKSSFAGWPSIILVITALYFAKEVFIPIALAILFAFLLSPLVLRLKRWGWRTVPSVFTVVSLACLVVAAIGSLAAFQLYDLTNSLPAYRENIQSKLKLVRLSEGGILSRAMQVFEEQQTNRLATGTTTLSTNLPNQLLTPLKQTPIPVEIHEPPPTSLRLLQSVLGNLLNPLATTGIVIVFVIFMLLQRDDLRNRFLRLLGLSQLNLTTQALDETASRVSRYLLMQLLVNASYGIPVGIGLYFIGVPNAFIWGLLATLLRFIPYVGPVMASIFPIGLAFAVDPGWTKPVLTIFLFVVLELVSNNLIEPWLYGSSTGISSFAIIVAAVFWTWLWGPIGLFLATPLTVCLAVMGKYVPHLEFLDIVLGDEPVLAEDARFYQRLLANDREEAAELAEDVLRKESLEHLYDKVVIPALSLAEYDRHEGFLDAEKQRFILKSTESIVKELGAETNDSKVKKDEVGSEPPTVLCIPANDHADEICAVMLTQLLHNKGVTAKPVSADTLATERFEEVKESRVSVVCVSALPPSALRQARLFCKRLRSEFPELKIVIGVWTKSPDLEYIRSRLPPDLVDHLATNLPAAVEVIRAMGSTRIPAGPSRF